MKTIFVGEKLPDSEEVAASTHGTNYWILLMGTSYFFLTPFFY